MMHFSNGQRNGVALPYFFQALGNACPAVQPFNPYRFGVDITVPSVASDLMTGMEFRAVIEEELARSIMIDSYHVRRCVASRQFLQLAMGKAGTHHIVLK